MTLTDVTVTIYLLSILLIFILIAFSAFVPSGRRSRRRR